MPIATGKQGAQTQASQLRYVKSRLDRFRQKPVHARLHRMPKTYSTLEAAKLIGVPVTTLHRWLAADKLRPFVIELTDGRKLWRWNDRDVAEGRKLKASRNRGLDSKRLRHRPFAS